MVAMNEALEMYTPDEAAECLSYGPDPDFRIYKALWATLDSDLWTVFIRACDGTHATGADRDWETSQVLHSLQPFSFSC